MLIPVRDLSTTACFTTRFDGLDSSISCRIACRSSVAETTGNRSIKTQPKSTKGRIRSKCRPLWMQTDSLRHIQMAGNAKVSQRRLSNNSICDGTPRPNTRSQSESTLVFNQSCKILSTSQRKRKDLYARATDPRLQNSLCFESTQSNKGTAEAVPCKFDFLCGPVVISPVQ